MRTAVLYSGEARTIGRLIGNHRFHLLSKLPNPTIFVSVADDANADAAKLIGGPCAEAPALPEIPLFFEKVAQPSFEGFVTQPTSLSGYPSASPQAILRQFWHFKRVWDFMQANSKHGDFDYFVRVRCDSCFMRVSTAVNPELTETLCLTPKWSKWGGVNDRFAILGRSAASAYFTVIDDVPKLLSEGCPLHPETLLATQLDNAAIDPQAILSVEFSTLREDGSKDSLEVSGIDLLDAAKA